jgi:hypothetical protein
VLTPTVKFFYAVRVLSCVTFFYVVSVLACVTFRLLAATDICGHADHSDLLALVLTAEDRGLALGNGSARVLAINPKGGRVARYPATIEADFAVVFSEILFVNYHFFIKLS